jgi:regulator of RNase E activity RraA
VDWWEYCASLPDPKIMVMEDVDRVPGTGALFGEIHATIAARLGFVAYVSNGTIRDVAALREKRFQCFSHGVSVSHSYAHVVEFGEPVEVGGLKIATGDVLHGDEHGLQSVPLQVAAELPDRVAQVRERESRLLEFCRSDDFRMEGLAVILKDEGVLCPSPRSRFV